MDNIINLAIAPTDIEDGLEALDSKDNLLYLAFMFSDNTLPDDLGCFKNLHSFVYFEKNIGYILENMDSLQNLKCNVWHSKDWKAIGEKTGLRSIRIYDYRSKDLEMSSINKLSNLRFIEICNQGGSIDLNGIGELEQLYCVVACFRAGENRMVSNIEALVECKNIRRLQVCLPSDDDYEGDQVYDISKLAELPKLSYFGQFNIKTPGYSYVYGYRQLDDNDVFVDALQNRYNDAEPDKKQGYKELYSHLK